MPERANPPQVEEEEEEGKNSLSHSEMNCYRTWSNVVVVVVFFFRA